MKQYYVYILKCKDGSYYTGVTNDLEERFQAHQSGIAEGYTKSKRPVKLVFNQVFYDINEAISAEKQIKGWRRTKKESLISGNYELLKELSKRYT